MHNTSVSCGMLFLWPSSPYERRWEMVMQDVDMLWQDLLGIDLAGRNLVEVQTGRNKVFVFKGAISRLATEGELLILECDSVLVQEWSAKHQGANHSQWAPSQKRIVRVQMDPGCPPAMFGSSIYIEVHGVILTISDSDDTLERSTAQDQRSRRESWRRNPR